MIVLLATYTIKSGHLEEVVHFLKEISVLVKQTEPGCKAYQVAQSQDDADKLVLIEQYEDAAALAFHRETPHFKSIIEGQVVPLLISRERQFLDLILA